jgi:hypothetical protein
MLPIGFQYRQQVESQVHLGGGLAPMVFCPVDAACDQLHNDGVHCMNSDLETPQQAFAFFPAAIEGLAYCK